MLDLSLRRLVEVHLDETTASEADASALADDLRRVDEVLEDVIVHSSQSTAIKLQKD